MFSSGKGKSEVRDGYDFLRRFGFCSLEKVAGRDLSSVRLEFPQFGG